MAFHNSLFPTGISWGSISGVRYRTHITKLTSGHEQRVATWAGGIMQFNVAYGVKDSTDLAIVQRFHRAREGALHSFPFKDWLDYHSDPDDPTYQSAPGTEDQLLGAGDGSTTTFQLRKAYSDGVSTVYRTITKPVDGTVQIWVNSILQTESTHYTIDYDTGIVTFVSAPTGGHDVTASFEFHVPVRFSEESDRFLGASAQDFSVGEIPDITLDEVLGEAGGHEHEFLYGGSREQTFNADITANPATAHTWRLDAQSTGLDVNLPDPTNLPDGRPLLNIINNGSNAFNIKNEGGTTIVSPAANESAWLAVMVQSGGSKKWYAV